MFLSVFLTSFQDVLAATRRAEEVTRNNCECTLNVALAYTSRFKKKMEGYWDLITGKKILLRHSFTSHLCPFDLVLNIREEMTRAARDLAAAVKTGQLKESEVNINGFFERPF